MDLKFRVSFSKQTVAVEQGHSLGVRPHNMGKMFHTNANLPEQIETVFQPVFNAIEDPANIAQIDETLGTHDTWKMCHKNMLFNCTRTVTVDDGVFLGVQTAAIPRLVPVTLIG